MKNLARVLRNGVKGFPIFQYLAMFTGCLNIISAGMYYGWPSPSLPQLLAQDSYIPITNDEGSWIAVMFLIGGVCGSIIAGVLLDRIGRKNVILLTSIPFFTAWIMVAYAQSFILLLAARFTAGISNGVVFCSMCMYLTEIADAKIRGSIGCNITVLSIFGMLLMNIIGSYFTITAAALIASIIPVLLLLTFIWMPESPYYLIMKGKFKQARSSLKTFKATDDVEDELNRLKQAIEEQNLNTGRYLDLFTVDCNRKSLFTVMGVRGFQQLNGSMAMVMYAQAIFKDGGSAMAPHVASMIYFGVQMVVSAFSTMLVDKTGRKPLMVISITGLSLALFIEGCYFYVKNKTNIDTGPFALVSVVTLFFFITMYSLGMQTIPILLTGEVFPTNVKTFAISFMNIYFCVVTVTVSKLFQFTKDEFGLHVPFFAFAVCSVLGLVFIVFLVPETKGKTLEDIQQGFKVKRGKNSRCKTVKVCNKLWN